MTFNACLIAFLLTINVSIAVSAQKKVETTYYNANGDSVKTKAEASYYRVIQTNGKNRVTVKYDSLDMKLEEISFRKDKPRGGVGDSVWWKYGSYREWFPSRKLKIECSYLFDRLHDALKTYYPNGVLRRDDVYYIDSLRQGHCYAQDSSEVPFFPYQVNPEFKGGQNAMFQYLAETVSYPLSARQNNEEGTVYVGFVVDETGNLVDIKIKRGVSRSLNKEALRVVKSMQKWTPGKLDGELVRVAYTLPIKFKFE